MTNDQKIDQALARIQVRIEWIFRLQCDNVKDKAIIQGFENEWVETKGEPKEG